MKPGTLDVEAARDSADASVGLLSEVEAGLSEKSALYAPLTRRKRALNVVHKIFQVTLVYSKLFFFFLLPSFISDRLLASDDKSRTKKEVRPIAYLDGMRGVAAWAIVNTHLTPVICRTTGAGWSHEGHWDWWRFPGLRLLYNGAFGVGLFFIIGGWTCSLSVVAAMNNSPRKSGTALEKSAAAAFKRPLRLILPSFVAMMIVFVLVRLNILDAMKAHSDEYNVVLDGWQPLKNWPERMPSFYNQLKDLIYNMGDLLKIWTAETSGSYALKYYPPLWTIKSELRASFLLYIVHMALFFVKRRMRLILTCLFITLGFALCSMDMPFFLIGYLIAEYMAMNPLQKVNKSFLKSLGWWLLFLVSMYLGSYPNWQDIRTPSHAWLRWWAPFRLEPHDRWFVYMGAACFVLAVSRIPILMRVFSSPIALYFGKISFALYLVHFWIVHIVGSFTFYHAWLWTGEDTKAQTYLGFVLAYPIVQFCVIWVADIFTRAFETPLANLGVKLQKQLFTEQ